MLRKYFTGSLILLVILGLTLSACVPTNQVQAAGLETGPNGRGRGNGAGNGSELTPGNNPNNNGNGGVNTGIALSPLSDSEIETLKQAIDEEYNALGLYISVLNSQGDVYPFNVIASSEQQHINVLERQAIKYGINFQSSTTNQYPTFTTLADACQAGVDAEIADAALYDELLPAVNHADLTQVFTNLRNASLNNHLPAFETCN
jgi:hypothetical protein